VRRPDLLGAQRTDTVTWFNEEKGHGRITADDGEVLFAHLSDIVADDFRSLVPERRVGFVATTLKT
jgi:cold shock CspA family protein